MSPLSLAAVAVGVAAGVVAVWQRPEVVVPIVAAVPRRATALLRDGTYSFATGHGTGSWHGGVERWL